MKELKNKIIIDIRSSIKYLEKQEFDIDKCNNWIDLFYMDACYNFQVDILKNILKHEWFNEAEYNASENVIAVKTSNLMIRFSRKNKTIEITDYANEKLVRLNTLNKEFLSNFIKNKQKLEEHFNIVEKFIKNNRKYSKEWFKDYFKLVDLYMQDSHCCKYEAVRNCTNYFDNRWLRDCIYKIKNYEKKIKEYEEKIKQIETNANETIILIKEIIEVDLKQFTDNIVIK